MRTSVILSGNILKIKLCGKRRQGTESGPLVPCVSAELNFFENECFEMMDVIIQRDGRCRPEYLVFLGCNALL